MDIAKYVGLFLNKNRYCNLPNLGEFTVNKKPATYNDGQMNAPEYEVSFKFSGGLIDDAFANFVANNERISIASAANGIKDFSVATRQTLAEGGSVVIPGFGSFINVNGKNEFKADPNIEVQTQSIPIFKINTEATQSTVGSDKISDLHEKLQLKEPTAQEDIVIKPPTVNWGKVIALAAIVLVVLGGIGGAIWYMNNNKDNSEVVIADEINNTNQQAAATPADTNTVKDTATTVKDTANAAAAPATVAPSPAGTTTFGIATYKDMPSAEKREKQLKNNGHNVALKTQSDSSIILTIAIPNVTDVEKAKDSLRRFFNPKGTVTVQ